MIKYGLISETDARCLEKTIDLICDEFKDEIIFITEVGVYGGDTGHGLIDYINHKKDRGAFITGIDNGKDGEELRFHYNSFIIGDSNEVYNEIGDNSQHLIFVDGCHCFAHGVSDFFCYAPKVKVDGYLAFHDTGKHIRSFKGFQHGDQRNPGAYISVRKALEAVRLPLYELNTWNSDGTWELIFDEADINDEAGGICVFKKL